MNSNSTPATFWLFWHMIRDQSLLTRATTELNACRTTNADHTQSFDTTKLCNQPLLQSSYAETLRLYVAVYLIRKPEYEDAQVLEYRIPKDKMIVISSAMAHMDKRNWNLGTLEEHPVEKFWAERFLTYGNNNPRASSNRTVSAPVIATTSTPPSAPTLTARSTPPSAPTFTPTKPSEPKFSLNGCSGVWIPFGGGLHQCPGRHWVKLQMLLSFAIVSSAFEIELAPGNTKLKVDIGKYGLGALNPGEKAPFRIRRKGAAV